MQTEISRLNDQQNIKNSHEKYKQQWRTSNCMILSKYCINSNLQNEFFLVKFAAHEIL